MNILVMDGQGGRLGAQLIKEIRARLPQSRVMAVGTNSAATAAMLKAGADESATGENPVIVACRSADIIVGPIGILVADAMLGEITEKMACAVARAEAKRILIPMNRCDNLIAGVGEQSLSTLIADAVDKLANLACPLD